MEIIGLAGFATASFAYFLFILLILAARPESFAGKLVFLSGGFTLFTSLLAGWQIYQSSTLKIVLVFENLKYLMFMTLILSTHLNVFSLKQAIKNQYLIKYLVLGIFTSIIVWLSASYFEGGSKYLFILFLLLSLATTIALEQLYRNADVKAKWALWPLVIGVGLCAVFDFIIFAQAAMVEHLNFEFWYARGYLLAIGMPFLLISARRMKNWSVDVFVSRDVVFYSSMLMISGLYLLVLALAGYAIKIIGGHWGSVISIAFLGLGGTVLVVLLLTERLRREVKVFITKHFYANKYDYRVEWLKSIEQLEVGSGGDCYQTATDIICQSINASGGILIKVDSGQQFKVMAENHLSPDLTRTTQLENVCKFFEHKAWIVDIREYSYIEKSYPELALDADYAAQNNIDLIIPITTGDKLWGMFLLSLGNKTTSKATYLNWEDRDLLFAVTRQLSNYLSLNEANSELAESKQFEAFHRMSAFLVHDLKNIQGQLALINSNASRHRENPAFIDDVFETIESATNRLDKVLNQLRNKQTDETKKTKVDLNLLVNSVAEQRNLNAPAVEVNIKEQLLIEIEADELQSVINHLVQNAQEATPENGWVKIKATQDGGFIRIAVVDNGIGMSQDFIKNRLFKPFDTTKGNAGMGIGVYEAKQFVEKQGGNLQVTSFENEGTIFQLSLPNQKN